MTDAEEREGQQPVKCPECDAEMELEPILVFWTAECPNNDCSVGGLFKWKGL